MHEYTWQDVGHEDAAHYARLREADGTRTYSSVRLYEVDEEGYEQL